MRQVVVVPARILRLPNLGLGLTGRDCQRSYTLTDYFILYA